MENKKHEMRNIRYALAALMLLMVLLRYTIIIIADKESFTHTFVLVYNTVLWFVLALFMIYCSMNLRRIIFTDKQFFIMKTLSLLAMIGSIAKVFLVIITEWPVLTNNLWPSLHNILEICIWTGFAIFFFLYWDIRVRGHEKHKRFKARQQKKESEERERRHSQSSSHRHSSSSSHRHSSSSSHRHSHHHHHHESEKSEK